MKNSILVFIAVSALFISSCKQADNTITPTSKAATYYGQSLPFGGDSIRSWIKTDLNGNVTSIGVTFSKAAYDVVKTQPDSTFMLMLPKGINTQVNPPWSIDHIQVDWSANGDPMQPYNVAQMDVHFFGVDTATQNAVTSAHDDLTMAMDTSFYPRGYMIDMMTEAMMGVHVMDTTDHTNPFTHTLMYGFYHANMYFIEPMISAAFLNQAINSSADIRQPSAFKKSGFYPTKYYVRYDSQLSQYSMSIDNFVSH